MEQLAWLFWIILGVGLIITEIFTFGFVLFWFGIGALVAALAGFLGLDLRSIYAFCVVSICSDRDVAHDFCEILFAR